MIKRHLLTLTFAFSCYGCGTPDEPETGLPPSITFSGKPDPRLAGIYKQDNADITMILREDGGLKTKGTVNARGRVLDVSGKGRWAVEGKYLFMEVDTGNGKQVNRRTYEVKENKLVLTSDLLPKPTAYTRVREPGAGGDNAEKAGK